MQILLTIVAFCGILLGKISTAFEKGLELYRPKGNDHAMAAMNFMAQQNVLLMQHIISMQKKFMDEVVSSPSSSGSQGVGEISCSTEDIDLVRSLLDEESERVVKLTASWAHNNVESYSLELRRVSIEPDKASDPDRTNDVVLVFHVKGTGDDALRFQADCSRKLREICSDSNALSIQCLRTDVRWS